ncbi:cellulase family glycosylhydrolase [Paenibacillus prosopidis]|uniref:Aryl-phospho-beta-D-glucosidase BglC (GH1 family) n=1 Tax=Paenibacillus prosopidis TaxID=630520 RepID=A0A368VVS2_9BACL|nr:cellulase family glycosylhydrolase [Paenibacillus prosopidis]RCW45440.1 aryl-phospho-beta-D-glucosidase BglC (GH1 family) [Paenibacillus prosopidis]
MSKKRSFLSIMLTLALMLALFTSTVSAAANQDENVQKVNQQEKSIQSYVNAMQPGWNLGNTFDALGSDETAWGNPRVTKEMINQIAAQGFKSIRIPITWMQHAGPGPDYTIDPAWMNRVQEVVDWSLDAGLYVMINLHHDSWMWVNTMGTNHDPVLAEYQAAWTQIANHFKKYPNKLMFESINEPSFNVDRASQFKLLEELNTAFHKIVRESGGKNAVRPLVLPTLWTNAGQEHLDSLTNTIAKLNDPNLIATIHYYGFWPFSVNIAGFTKFDETTKNDIITNADRIYDSLVAKGIPVIMGEFGLLGFDQNTGTIEHGEMLKFFEFLLHYTQSKNITHMLWDNGQHFNRNTFMWADQELYDMMKASWKGRSSTAETDLIYIKKGAAIQDAVIKLNLNGNALKAIRAGADKLRLGTDYELNGDVLTVKASLLSKLTATGQFGENAVLTAKFNSGADWHFDVLYYDTPKLQNVEGTTGDFAIPTAFNGDRLATMEAVYATGGNAGPQNWTSFKEFAYTFEPSYDTNQIKLKPNFFNEVNDGVVQLKFHFWSGEIVNYTITKNGASIVGEAS